jgi:DNA-binding response OmpR family regulator
MKNCCHFRRKNTSFCCFFIKNRNAVLSRDTILDRVWGIDYFGDARTVDTHIKRLRQKLKHRADWIITVKGFGYKFRVDA